LWNRASAKYETGWRRWVAQTLPPERVGRVLVVDDNDDVRNSLTEVLRVGGYDVIAARNDDEALGVLAEGRVGLLLLDHGVLTGSGMRLLDRLDKPPPVIMISGSNELPVVNDPRVSVMLQKPISPQRLFDEVARYHMRT
jgi:DNA-binding response OmpR family regulator